MCKSHQLTPPILGFTTLLPFLVLPKQVVIHQVYYVIIFLNCEIFQNGISATLSPREIVLRRRLDWLKHCCSAGVPLKFGEYVKTHEDPGTTNTMRSHTFLGIYLGPTGNLQGTKKVFDLNTGAMKKPRSVI